MHLHFNSEPTLNLNRFRRLGIWYVVALGIIAMLAIAGQVLIQWHISDQHHDSQIVNVAGKQRMLSQRISKTVLMLSPGQTTAARTTLSHALASSLVLWKTTHDGLQYGNDSLQIPGHNHPEVAELFSKVDPHFNRMYESAAHVVALLAQDPDISYDSLEPAIGKVLAHEDAFLAGMENIALWYAAAAREKVTRLSTTGYLLLMVLLLVILLEILFIFRPTARNINKTMNQLMASEQNAQKLSKEIGALYASLEKSYEQVARVNQPVENPRLYAKADRGGTLTYISDSFKLLAGDLTLRDGMRISDLFQGMTDADDWMDDIIDTVADGRFWQGEVRTEKLCCVMIIITPVYSEQEEITSLLVMGMDVTHQKMAEQSMKQKNHAEIEKKINQQKFRSVLILEGQEEERNRIAMDIHDGIGQMLTSLKYQIESIDVKAGDKAERKIAEVGQLLKQVIREVRRVTFNLKPTVLGDYGLQAAMKVFVQETAKLVDIKLIYNTSGEIDRLPQKIENNIFRIVQEAINNAIKYSAADVIEVTLSRVDDSLLITVKDEGKGFDTRLVEARSVNMESGRGFFNMYERTEYVNGELTIQSKPLEGTTVTLKVPLQQLVSLEVV